MFIWLTSRHYSILIFLDEPTSGLDGQAAFNTIRFLRKLADVGQAVLVTIHQPSASLFAQFDTLLLLARGGKTVYFGEIGDDAATLKAYFAKHGARKSFLLMHLAGTNKSLQLAQRLQILQNIVSVLISTREIDANNN